MIRRALILMTMASAGLAILLLALWVRSASRTDWVSVGRLPLVPRGWMAWSADGRVAISLTVPSDDPRHTFHESFSIDRDDRHWRIDHRTYDNDAHAAVRLGDVGFYRVTIQPAGGPSNLLETIVTPYAVLLALTVAFTGVGPVGLRLQSRRREARGLCPRCAYPTAGARCPECGRERGDRPE